MATETKTFYPGAYDQSDYSYASISGATNPVGKGSNNTGNYATINLKTGSRATTHTRWPFDCSSIPPGATIDSVSCKVAAQASSTSSSYVPTRTLQLHSGTTAKGSATTISSTNRSVYTLSCGTWTRDELQNCNLYIYAARGTSSTTGSQHIRFYGADLTVEYTYRSEKFVLKLGGSWADVARVFKKVNGVWIEQTNLANVIGENVRYQNGGEIESPNHFVSIHGSGDTNNCYVTINGVKYTSGAKVSVEHGSVVTFTAKSSYTSYPAYIYLNESPAQSGATAVYNHSVASSIIVDLYYEKNGTTSYYGDIFVYTGYSGGEVIEFTIQDANGDKYDYRADEGITWAECCEKEYGFGLFAVSGNRIAWLNLDGSVYAHIADVKPADLIVPGKTYTIQD